MLAGEEFVPMNFSKETLFLFALATGNRVSEQASLHYPSVRSDANDSVVTIPVRPGFTFKNQRQNRAPLNISFQELREEYMSHPLCPVRALRHYLLRTQGTRTGDGLFINPRTGSNSQSPSISMWLCRTIEQACTGVWCIPPDEIIMRGFWATDLPGVAMQAQLR